MNSADLAQALEQALYDRLTAIVTLVNVFQHVPDNRPPPVVIIGDMNVEEVAGAKVAPSLERIEFDIISLVHGPSRKPLNALQREVKNALDRWRPAQVGDVVFGEVTFLDGNGLLIPEEVIYYGTQRFACLVQ